MSRGVGSPPRVRSRRCRSIRLGTPRGITSACAEQTFGLATPIRSARDHLRVCGADPDAPSGSTRTCGSPPRVRSRLVARDSRAARIGITSACAEQTAWAECGAVITWDHLRVCGADRTGVVSAPSMLGSPPRVRSRPHWGQLPANSRGITSACAEQTDSTSSNDGADWDHLRVCGADEPDNSPSVLANGSPPRVRSRRHPAQHG